MTIKLEAGPQPSLDEAVFRALALTKADALEREAHDLCNAEDAVGQVALLAKLHVEQYGKALIEFAQIDAKNNAWMQYIP